MTRYVYAPFLIPSLFCLASGLLGGFLRMAGIWPLLGGPVLYHGGLMAIGFLASLIALERCVGGGFRAAGLASLCFSLGGVALVLGAELFNKALWAVGGASFLAWAILSLKRFRKNFSTIFFIASSAFLALGIYHFVVENPPTYYGYAWVGFFTSFIAGERMDMLKIANASRKEYLLAGAAIPLAAAAVTVLEKNLMAAAFLIMVLAVARRDFAIRFVWRTGFSRYLGVGLLTAYAWLVAAAALWFLTNSFDSLLHTVFLGYAGTMVFAHAPIILPAILRIPQFYSPHLYIPFTMLQAATALRMVAGHAYQGGLWALSGWLTVLSILTFATVALSNLRKRKVKKALSQNF